MKDYKLDGKKKLYMFTLGGLCLLVLIAVLFSQSFALFKKEIVARNINIQIGELNYRVESTELTNGSITVPGGTSKDVTLQITSQNPINTKYELVYNAPDLSNIEVGYYDNTSDPVLGTINKAGTKTVSLKVVNNGSTSQTVSFLVEGGFDYNELEISKGNRITKEFASYVPEPAPQKVFASGNLGNNCKTYNDGENTFLVGQCSRNYVWYSGKLWRVVLKNNATGAVKMVTDNSMTTISYGGEAATFADDYIDQWLSQEFLPTLHNYENYLVVDSTWNSLQIEDTESFDASTSNGLTTIETIQRTVGILNPYEYYTTYGNSGSLATSETGYLNNGIWWWLMGNSLLVTRIYVGTPDGTLNEEAHTVPLGIRPSVNLKSTIRIISGNGTRSAPYQLEGDRGEITKGTTLLSTRYSGEYIKFNNSLYRIVDIENGLTKITAVDKPAELANNKFHSASGQMVFSTADIKVNLEAYYQGLNESIKNMIEPNTTWYQEGLNYSDFYYPEFSYKASICKTVDTAISTRDCVKTTYTTTANVALPRYGEMFTSQITRGTKTTFWTLTPSSAAASWYVKEDGSATGSSPGNTYGARPSMYLKSNVVISSTNTGDGTYEHPYDIELK